MRLYFAAALFTQMERKWNRTLAQALEETMPGLDIILPQDFTPAEKHVGDKLYGALFRMCVKGIEDADAVLAMIEGDEIDSGTAWEMGYAYARNKPVIGVRTDFRPGADHGVNFMLSRSCRFVVQELSLQEDCVPLARAIVRRLKKISEKK